MFLKKNIKKMRSLVSGFAVAGVAATALFLGANASTTNAKTAGDETNAPSGGALNKFLDFNGNGTTDFATVSFAPTGSGGPISWRVAGNPASPLPNQAFIRRFNYGLADDDSIVVGDYVGDSRTDLTVFRNTAAPAPGYWYISQFPTGTGGVIGDRRVQWGDGFTDSVTTGDYDGDGKADYAAIRVENGNIVWYILGSTNVTRRIVFGLFTGATGPSIFNGADFNADGRDELVYVTRNAAGTVVNYFVGDAVTGAGVITRSFGNYNTDSSLTPADYTGDGRADFVACRQTALDGVAVWYILNSATGTVTATRFGIADPNFTDGDIPVRGDYDGDNRHDIAVWRPSNRTFYYISSQFSNFQAQQFGDDGDTPLGAFGIY